MRVRRNRGRRAGDILCSVALPMLCTGCPCRELTEASGGLGPAHERVCTKISATLVSSSYCEQTANVQDLYAEIPGQQQHTCISLPLKCLGPALLQHSETTASWSSVVLRHAAPDHMEPTESPSACSPRSWFQQLIGWSTGLMPTSARPVFFAAVAAFAVNSSGGK